jgi:membrane protease YdiL (CAAX protease family)
MNTQNQSNQYTRRNLTIFTILVLASGWLGRWLDALTGSTSSEGIGMLVWIIAPLGVSFLLRAFAGDGWQDLGLKPAFKGNGLWYAISILVYPICATLILVIGLALGAISLSSLAGPVGIFVQAFVLLLVSGLLINIFEEFGFRGYLAPKIYTLPLNIFVAHGLVGLIWGVWHLPYLTAITPYTMESLATLMPRFLVGTIVASIVYGEIRLLTNSVWPAVLMQIVGGAFVGALMLDDLITISSGAWLFRPVVEGGLMIILFILIGVGIYLWRTRRMATAHV